MTASLDGATGAKAGASASRLAALRDEMTRLQVQGFIVPHADEYQGEYLPVCAERMAWLTGFSGSAGTVVVLADKAAVFIDGRYTLQARQEVDQSLFELLCSSDTSHTEWIAANMPADTRLAYDPWLHTANQLKLLKRACKKAGCQLEALADNPLDIVWTDRPSPPISPVVPYEVVFAGETSTSKRQQIADEMKQEKLAAVVLSAPDSIAWLLNIRGGDIPFTPLALARAIIYDDAFVDLFIDRRKLAPGLDRHLGDEVVVYDVDDLAGALDNLGKKAARVRLNPAHVPAWICERLKIAGGKIVDGVDPCAIKKACKNAVEMDGIRSAHRRDGVALTRFLAWLSRQVPGPELHEMSAAAKLESLRREGERFRGLSFSTISATGENGAIVHYRVSEKSNRHLENAELYLVDSGGQYLDGTTDVTRTVAIGQPTAEMRCDFTRVLKGHIALASAIFPQGTSGSQLDTLARKALWDVGLDYNHGTGHGVGCYLNVHEGPQRVAKRGNNVALQPGMVISDEPGYYKSGEYGIRIESLLVVTPLPGMGEKEMLGFETLTLAPIDMTLIEPTLLDAREALWLDAYHVRVRKELQSLVDEQTAQWLEQATRPVGWI